MSPYSNHFPSKILNNFIPLFPGSPRIRENFLTRRDVAEGEVSTRKEIVIYPRVGIWQMEIPSEQAPSEDLLVLGEKQPKLL